MHGGDSRDRVVQVRSSLVSLLYNEIGKDVSRHRGEHIVVARQNAAHRKGTLQVCLCLHHVQAIHRLLVIRDRSTLCTRLWWWSDLLWHPEENHSRKPRRSLRISADHVTGYSSSHRRRRVLPREPNRRSK